VKFLYLEKASRQRDLESEAVSKSPLFCYTPDYFLTLLKAHPRASRSESSLTYYYSTTHTRIFSYYLANIRKGGTTGAIPTSATLASARAVSTPKSHAVSTPKSHVVSTPKSHVVSTPKSRAKATPKSRAKATPKSRAKATPKSRKKSLSKDKVSEDIAL
jgi:hypothetical protein